MTEAKALLTASSTGGRGGGADEYKRAMDAYSKAVNIEPEHAYQLILALRARGVEYLVSPYEADAQLAHLARTGYVWAVLSEDSDLVAYGCPRVLTKHKEEVGGRWVEVVATRRGAAPASCFF